MAGRDVAISVRVSKELKERVEKAAEEEGRTVANWVERAINQALQASISPLAVPRKK